MARSSIDETALAGPYFGPWPVPSGSRLFGRDREVADLVDILTAERIVLLYSPSGAGKTSLIQAALVPHLMNEERFDVLPVMKLRLKPPPERRLPCSYNRYVLSLLLCLDEGLPPRERTPVEQLAGMTLCTYLNARPAAAGTTGRVLIFDQFEDILTLDPIDPRDRPVKRELFAQVGAILANRRWWALFSMREEFRAGLDPYLQPVPTRLQATYRLELLSADAALAAVREPAQAAGVSFPEALARKLVDDLSTIRVPEERPGDFVEPVHLQLVCLRIWQRVPPGAKTITEKEVGGVQGVDEALTAHYDESVRAAALAAGDFAPLRRERAIREWFGTKLIKEKIRDQVLQSPEDGLSELSLKILVDAYLVRADERRGMTWYELTHDRLINPILRSNRRWFDDKLSPLERQAALWASKNESPAFLFQGGALSEAEKWTEVNAGRLSPIETRFLAECRKARATAEREHRTAQRIRLLALVASVAAVLALVAFLAAVAYAWRAQNAEAELRVKSDELAKLAAREVAAPVEVSQGVTKAMQKEAAGGGSGADLEVLDRLINALNAKTQLQLTSTTTVPAERKSITLRYFAKQIDRAQVQKALQPLGFNLQLADSQVSGVPTNCIWYGSSVRVEDVRTVALVLLQAGIKLQGIQPFQHSTAANASTIQVGGSARLDSLPGITPDDVKTLGKASSVGALR